MRLAFGSAHGGFSPKPPIRQLKLTASAQVHKVTVILGTLIWAANWGHVEVVQLLLSAGAEKNKVTSGGETALSLATSGGHQEIAQLLQSAAQ